MRSEGEDRQEGRLMKALELRQGHAVREVGPGRFVVRSQSRENKTFGVGIKHGEHYCGCESYEIKGCVCKHIISCFAPSLIHFAFQARYVAQDLEDLELICDHYRAEINALHPVFRAMAKAEKEAARERLTGMTLAKAA